MSKVSSSIPKQTPATEQPEVAGSSPEAAKVEKKTFSETFWKVDLKPSGSNYYEIGTAFLTGEFEISDEELFPKELLEWIANNSITSDSQQRIEAFAAMVAYSGFDVAHIRKKLWDYFQKDAPNKSTSGQAASVFFAEMYMIIVLFLQRGANVLKMGSTMTSKASVVVTALRSKYVLVNSGRGDRDAITLPRVAQAFAEITACILQETEGIRTLGALKGFPRGLMFSGAASMIYGRGMLFLYVAWSKTQDSVINLKSKKTKLKLINQLNDKGQVVEVLVDYPNFAHFSEISFSANTYSNQQRIVFTYCLIKNLISRSHFTPPEKSLEAMEEAIKVYVQTMIAEATKTLSSSKILYGPFVNDDPYPANHWKESEDAKG